MKYLIAAIILFGFSLFVMAFLPAWRSRAIGMAVIMSVVLLVAGGSWPLLIGLRSIWWGLASAHWPTVPGVVLKTEMTESESKSYRSTNVYMFYIARLTFGYQMYGKEYTTQNLQFGRAVGSGDAAEATILLLRYAPGTRVPIHYNPDDPSIATVKTGVNSDIVWFLVAGTAFILFAVFVSLGYFTHGIPSHKFFAGIFCSIFTLLGIGIMTPGLQNLLYARASLTWPTTKAVVVYLPEQSGNETSEEGQQDRIDPATGYVFSYQTTPNGNPLAYMYEVNGVKHFSGLRYFGQVYASSDSWAYDILQRYPTGADIPVIYCPTDPDLAVLEHDCSPEAYGLTYGGAAFILFALLVLAVTILKR